MDGPRLTGGFFGLTLIARSRTTSLSGSRALRKRIGSRQSIGATDSIVVRAAETVRIQVLSVDPQFSKGAALCVLQHLCVAPSFANTLGNIDCRSDSVSMVRKMTLDSPFGPDHPLVPRPENINLRQLFLLMGMVLA